MTFPIGNWTAEAACARADAETWFPDQGTSPRQAKAICLTCPVQQPCLAWALVHNIQYGVWGGTSPVDRQKMNRGAAA